MDVYLAVILLFGGNFAPNNFALCAGQMLAISQNAALFSLLGTSFGGNGVSSFGLPDLRGRVPRGASQGPGLSNVSLGEMGGTENVSILISNMPAHTHTAILSGLQSNTPITTAAGTSATPSSSLGLATLPTIGSGPTATSIKGYGTPTGGAFLAPGTVTGTVTNSLTGSNVPVNIMNPYLGINYIIALYGIFPSRN